MGTLRDKIRELMSNAINTFDFDDIIQEECKTHIEDEIPTVVEKAIENFDIDGLLRDEFESACESKDVRSDIKGAIMAQIQETDIINDILKETIQEILGEEMAPKAVCTNPQHDIFKPELPCERHPFTDEEMAQAKVEAIGWVPPRLRPHGPEGLDRFPLTGSPE